MRNGLRVNLHARTYRFTSPAGPATILIEDRMPAFIDLPGPQGATTAVVDFDRGRIALRMPRHRKSDNGGPRDQEWQRYNAAEVAEMQAMLDAAMPVIRRQTLGDPGIWTFDRDGQGEGDKAMVAERRLRRDGVTVDLRIMLPGGGQ